jgi:glutathione S-transferase
VQLRYSPTSPYVRKVMVCAIEKGVDACLDLVPTSVWEPDTDIGAVNPLGKVPALVTDEGAAIYDSRVICAYLDALSSSPVLVPPSGEARWRTLTLEALADGLLDAGIARFLEGRRAPGERSQGWMDRQRDKLVRGLDRLDAHAGSWGGEIALGQIAVGCLLGWLSFRLGEEEWRTGRPALAAWYDGFAARQSMVRTAPRE